MRQNIKNCDDILVVTKRMNDKDIWRMEEEAIPFRFIPISSRKKIAYILTRCKSAQSFQNAQIQNIFDSLRDNRIITL